MDGCDVWDPQKDMPNTLHRQLPTAHLYLQCSMCCYPPCVCSHKMEGRGVWNACRVRPAAGRIQVGLGQGACAAGS
eukprot:scaffold21829_cov25-Tisochrysis_lutea.AAC.2